MAEDLEATLASVRRETAFLEKYFGLRKRCEQMQQANEKMVNRLQHVKKIIKRHKREKKYMEARLAEFGDNYKESQVPVSWEEDQLFYRLRPNEPPPYPKSDQDEETNSNPTSTITTTAMSSIQPYLIAHGKKEGGVKSRTVKSEKEKDPNTPKKPNNVFQLFCKEEKQIVQAAYIKENNEDIAHHELTRRLAQKWHAMSQEDKKIYYDMHEVENERYREELKIYEANKLSMETSQSTTTSNIAAVHPSTQLEIKQEAD